MRVAEARSVPDSTQSIAGTAPPQRIGAPGASSDDVAGATHKPEPSGTFVCAAGSSYCLEPALSRIRFVAMKNGRVPTAGIFHDLGGEVHVGENGQVNGRIFAKASSVDTGNLLRDSRMVETFFQAGEFPDVMFTFQGAERLPETWEGLHRANVNGRFSLGSRMLEQSVSLLFKKSFDGEILVIPVRALTLKISELGRSLQLAEYLALCGALVDDLVEVDFTLAFKERRGAF